MSEKIIQLNEETVKVELKELVRKKVEETLNKLSDKDAEELTVAGKCERTESRQAQRGGHCNRKLTTASGEVRPEVPELKRALQIMKQTGFRVTAIRNPVFLIG